MNKRFFKIICISAVLSLFLGFSSYAAGWNQDGNGWWWKNDDGNWPASSWQWLDGNQDGVAECYYFNANGYLLTNQVTSDGYYVNADGAWVENGVVKTQTVSTSAVNNGTAAVSGQTTGNVESSIGKYAVPTSQYSSFGYWLFSPKNATENMPMIVYLHGYKRNLDYDLTGENGLPGYLSNGGKDTVPAYVLMPEISDEEDLRWDWMNYEASILEIIDDVANRYKIDRSRISIIGNSMGGDGALALTAAHPDLFYRTIAVAPFYTGLLQYNEAWVDGLKQGPLWFICEGAGKVRGKEVSAAAVEQINAAGGEAYVTVCENVEHQDMFPYMYQNRKVDVLGTISWLVGE